MKVSSRHVPLQPYSLFDNQHDSSMVKMQSCIV